MLADAAGRLGVGLFHQVLQRQDARPFDLVAASEPPVALDPVAATVDRYRHWSMVLILVAATLAVALDAAYRVRVDLTGFAMLGLALAGLLYLSRKWWRREGMERAADALGTVAVMTVGGLCCGAVAMLELRLGFPQADGMLHRADQWLGVDGIAVAETLARQDWLYWLLGPVYNFTLELFLAGLVVLSLMNDRLEAWRGAFCFVGTLLTVVAAAAFIPASGLVNWASPYLLAHLPTSFLAHFNEFYRGADPLLRLQVIDGVVTFPSFHAVVGFLVFAMWRTRPVARTLAAVWLVVELLSTVAGGHYLIDLIGGFAVWTGWFALSRRMEIPQAVWTRSLPLGGAPAHSSS